MLLTSPCLDLTRDLYLSDLPKHKTILCSNGRRLLLLPRQVIIITGSVISKRLTYDEDLLTAAYVTFPRHGNNSPNSDALVVCLRHSAYIYYPQGNSHIVSFPFPVKAAFTFDSGVLLEREMDAKPSSSSSSASASLPTLASSNMYEHRFFTLVDPLGDLCVVTTSSTSVLSSQESIIYFPAQGLNKTRFLCATFNSRLRSINVYYVKASIRHKNANGTLAQMLSIKKRKNFSVSSPTAVRILEDDLYDGIDTSMAPIQVSMNMEKKRTSTLLSGISSIARMGSESTISEPKSAPLKGSLELGGLRKNMIWTKIGLFQNKSKKLHLSISSLYFEGKEALVVSNRASKETKVYIYKKATSGSVPTYESSFLTTCIHALPLNHVSLPGWLVLLNTDSLLQLIHPLLEIESPPIPFGGKLPSMSHISGSYNSMLALRSNTESRRTFLVDLVLEPSNTVVSTCLKAWRYLSGSKINEQVKVVWRAALMQDEMKDEWNAYVVTILSLIFPFEEDQTPISAENEITSLLEKAKLLHDLFSINYSFYDLLPFIVVSLHLIYEEVRLDSLNFDSLNKIGTFLTQLTTWMGWLDQWTSHYMIDHQYIDGHVRLLLIILIHEPPDLIKYLTSLFNHSAEPFLKISQLVEESEEINRILTPKTHIMCTLYEILASNRINSDAAIKAMEEFQITPCFLETLPVGLSLPLKNYLSYCQNHPDLEWSSCVLELAGRRDLTALLEPESNFSDASSENRAFASGNEGRDAQAVLSSVTHANDSFLPWDGQSEADRIHITKLIFDKDRRYYEITSLLHQTRTQTATLTLEENTNEYNSTLMKRTVAALVGVRTVTIPLGRAALFYSGRMPFLTEKFPIPKFNLNTLISPSMTKIVLQEDAINAKVMEWGHFHNGVSSGLSISPSSTGITGSWVNFNKPKENNAQHAGFLLGLGLNGHLKKLEEWHIYNYLGPKHPLTSVGLLIGMAASLRATKDNKLTKVLSVHAVALLPQGANDLNVPLIVQAAGLIGIGLLYLETQHRRMSEILLTQVGEHCSHVESFEEQESYRLAAGIGLGLINLGKGNDLKGLSGTNVVDHLLSYAISMKDSHPSYEMEKSGSGSILALGFIYLRTENSVVAAKLAIPDSEPLLDYIRPDLLLLRCLAKNLILWSGIQCTREWVESQIPSILRHKYKISKIRVLDSDQVPYFHVLAGACLSLAIKYASSQNLVARDTLLYYLDICIALSGTVTENYDQKIAFGSLCQLENVLSSCVAIVMAGSGDLDVFRRLRVLHGRIDKQVDFGSHMAYSMALGHLFLGGGHFGFAKTNFAIASLVISLYPVYPNEKSDHEVHLQALRHFWALSVELRCFVVRDVKDGSPVKVPVNISFRNGERKQVHSPCLLPNIDEIAFIEVKSPEYFNVKIDFSVNSEYLERFKSSLVVYVLQKRNYETLKMSMAALLENCSRSFQSDPTEEDNDDNLQRIIDCSLTKGLTPFDKSVYLQANSCKLQQQDLETHAISTGLSIYNIIDTKLEMDSVSTRPTRSESIADLNFLFTYTDHLLSLDFFYVDAQFVERLKGNVRLLASRLQVHV